jgi:DNA-binding response OmpR family regulator
VLALKLGAIDFLQKPLLPDQLRDVIKEVIDRHAPGVRARKPRSIDDCLRCAKRAINLRDFAAARTCLRRALAMEPKSLRTRNLCGVMLEMENEHLITKGSQADSAPEQPVA